MSSSDGRLFIGATGSPSQGDQWITAYNPHTEEEFGRVAAAVRTDIEAAIAAARTAYDSGPWPRDERDRACSDHP